MRTLRVCHLQYPRSTSSNIDTHTHTHRHTDTHRRRHCVSLRFVLFPTISICSSGPNQSCAIPASPWQRHQSILCLVLKCASCTGQKPSRFVYLKHPDEWDARKHLQLQSRHAHRVPQFKAKSACHVRHTLAKFSQIIFVSVKMLHSSLMLQLAGWIRTINSSYYLNCTTCWIKLTHSFD